ncbi:cytochrome P450 734A5 [Oryza glaberrima]|uniref:Cytochrome P450 n=1 Tax=Oryza glaberrima TaxID=4538 RepID=I1QCQ0_ORYGL|nr:cytochrome P450 734A5 [Oryza glaberrima]
MWSSWAWTWSWSGAAAVAVAAAAAWVAVYAAAARAAEALWWRPRRVERHFAAQGVRGPGYRFFVGSSIELVRLMVDAASRPMEPPTSHDILPRVLPFYHHWRKLYGPMHLIWFGRTPRLVVSEPELIREVLLTRADHFDRYEAHPMICQFEGYGLSNLHGERWARRRRVLTPAFHTENLRMIAPFVAGTVTRMLDELAERARAGAGEAEVDVAEWFQRVPQEAITFAAFGRRNYDDGAAVFRLQDELAGYATEAHSKVYIPGYRFLPTRKNRRVWQLDREIRSHLAKFVTGLQSCRSSHGDDADDGGGMREFMSFMAPAMTAGEIIEESKNFFFAGKETLSNLLTWTTVALAMHPEWQERARREVVAVCGRDDLPTKDHLPKLKTLGMILNETLRLYPPAVAMIRTAKEDVELGGCVVPAGTEVMIPIMAVHHDAAAWGDDAAEFNPARFAADDDGGRRRHPMAFMPFGGGARVCIGQNMALMEAKVALAVVLRRFEFRLSPAYVHAPRVLMILSPQFGAPVIFRPLTSAAA